MNALFSYSLAVSSVLVLIYPVLYLTVSRNNSFRFNRLLLGFGLLAAFALPLITTLNVTPIRHLADTATVLTGDIVIKNAVTVTPQTPDSGAPVIMVLLGIYYYGVLVLTLKTLYSLLQLNRLKRHCRKELHDNHALYIHDNELIAPFSFGKSIFLSESDRNDPVIRHECGHVDANHWIDILIAELGCILLWYNPFMWLYKNLIKLNHEYEADHYVISSGIGISDYQHLLISKALGRRIMPLTNSLTNGTRNFRRRILIMSEGKTSSARKLLAALMIPSFVIAAALLTHPVSAKALSSITNFKMPVASEISDPQPVAAIADDTEDEINDTPATSSIQLPSPLTDQQDLHKVIEYSFKFLDKNDSPLKTNIAITIDKDGKVIGTDYTGEIPSDVKIELEEYLSKIIFNPTLNKEGEPVQIKIVIPVRKAV